MDINKQREYDVYEVETKKLWTGMRIEGFKVSIDLFLNQKLAIDYANKIINENGDKSDRPVCSECSNICCECMCCKSCKNCNCECCQCNNCKCSFCCRHVQKKDCCRHIFQDSIDETKYWCENCCKHNCGNDCCEKEKERFCGHRGTSDGLCQPVGPDSICCSHVCDETCFDETWCKCGVPKERFKKLAFESIDNVYKSVASGGYENWPDLTISIKRRKLNLDDANGNIYKSSFSDQ